MVDLVLDDLRRPAGVGFEAGFKALVLILHLDRAKAPGLSHAAEGQAALLRLIGAGASDDLRIEHDDSGSVQPTVSTFPAALPGHSHLWTSSRPV